MRIIALAGYAGTGKTTLATFAAASPSGVISMASPVKEIAKLLGWDGNKDDRGRRLLVDIGMAGRAFQEDMWIRRWWATAQASGYSTIYCDDIRFENEAQFIRSIGGVVVFLRREGWEAGANEAELFQPEWADHIIDIVEWDIGATFQALTRVLQS